jgi:hypothetical protein
MTYPSGNNPYQQPGPQSPQPYPPEQAWGSPPAPAYPPQPGYAPQPGYPQPPAYSPTSYGAPAQGYPAGQPYGTYAQSGMAQPGQPYAQPQAKPKAKNPMARAALIYGALSLGVNIVGLFLGFYLTGILAVYAIYAGIRALIAATKLPGNAGIGASVGGLIMALLSLAITVLGFALK